jgi:hypothetical protein
MILLMGYLMIRKQHFSDCFLFDKTSFFSGSSTRYPVLGYISRSEITGNKSKIVSKDDLSSFHRKTIMSAIEDVGLLVSLSRWQRRQLDYEALYRKFLIGAISEEMFSKLSEEFVVEKRHVSKEIMVNKIKRIEELTGFVMESDDYANFFKCPFECVLDAISQVDNDNKNILLKHNVLNFIK